ncbi:MAG TPA: hypothetical protein VJ577_10240 [Burkholderiaceae bacterium]|nr:hypothetical protein [Burkholderiaceae bacterium]
MDRESQDAMNTEALEALYAKTLYTLRESRKTLLRRYSADSEAALLEKIRSGEVAEHPAYDHYLSALIIEQTRMEIRAQALERLGGQTAADTSPISMHLMLKERLETHYAERLTEPVRLAQDAMLLAFDTGLMMEVRYFSSAEYAIGWSWGDAELRIDTAPLHTDCSTFPCHVHGDDNTLQAGPVNCPDTDCWTGFSQLLDILLADPLLEKCILQEAME